MVVSIYGGSAILPFKNPIVSLKRPKGKRYVDLKGWRELGEIIKNFKPDIIQANAADTLKYAVFSKMVFKWNVPIVYRNASASSFYIQNTFSRFFNYILLRNIDSIISVSESSKKDLNHLFPFTASKTWVIPVGIENEDRINSLENKFDKRSFNIIHAGSFTREKNHHGLLDIFKAVLKMNQHCVLHLLGDGDLKGEIETRIANENLDNKIFLHGGVKNPLAYIREADVLVLPSIIEGLPGVLLEAMYCKTPVIAYNVGGVGEIVMNGTGILVEEGNIEAFAKAIYQISEDPDFQKVENAYKMVMEKYVNSTLADMFYEKYLLTIESRV